MESQKNDTIGLGKERRRWVSTIIVRGLAFVFTLVAAIVLGVDKQTKIVPISISPNLPPLNVPVVAKWTHLSAFMYFVIINAIACSYAAISILLISLKRNQKSKITSIITVMDMLMVTLLSSSIGAAGAIGLMGFEGNSHVQWNKVCNVFDKFCHQAAAALALSLIGSLAFLLLPVFAAFARQD